MDDAPEAEQFGQPGGCAGWTGVGSMPGVSAVEAVSVVAGESGELPFLPELPARGAGADLIGRTGSLLAAVSRDLSIEPVPSGWRLTDSATRAIARSRSWLAEDLDRAEERFAGSPGVFKVQLAGPWTLAAAIEAPSGAPAVSDPGLVAELGAALAVAAADHVAEVRRRLEPRAVILQIDEPSLPAVLAGGIRTPSGMGRYPEVAVPRAAELLKPLADTPAAVRAVLHCCAEYPFDVAGGAGFDGVSVNLLAALAVLDEEVDARLATVIESGGTLYTGVVPATTPDTAPVARRAASGWEVLDGLWRRTGLDRGRLADVVVTPTCGLAGADWPQARRALETAAEISHRCCDQ